MFTELGWRISLRGPETHAEVPLVESSLPPISWQPGIGSKLELMLDARPLIAQLDWRIAYATRAFYVLTVNLCLVRIDGERTTGHWLHERPERPFGDSQVLAIFSSAAAVIHMG